MADIDARLLRALDGPAPQHQKGNGFVITGEDNPLPVSNYITTDSGILIPQRGTSDGSAHTKLTGSIVEYNITNQVEIRDDEVHSFPFELPSGLKDFDILITDTHHVTGNGNRHKTLDMYFAIYKDSSYPFGDVGVLSDDGDFYNWVVKIWSYNEARRLRTKIPSSISRNGINRKNITLEQALAVAESEFLVDLTLQEGTNYFDNHFPYENMKKAILSSRSTHFNIQFENLPEDISNIKGSISIKFRGYR